MDKYDDIIGLPHHVSLVHPQMTLLNRAAQFSPFAALTGHEAAIEETARATEERVELDENEKERLDERLQMIREHLAQKPWIVVTFFAADEKKSGGAYITKTGIVKKIDAYAKQIVLEEGTVIAIKDLRSLEGDLFCE